MDRLAHGLGQFWSVPDLRYPLLGRRSRAKARGLTEGPAQACRDPILRLVPSQREGLGDQAIQLGSGLAETTLEHLVKFKRQANPSLGQSSDGVQAVQGLRLIDSLAGIQHPALDQVRHYERIVPETTLHHSLHHLLDQASHQLTPAPVTIRKDRCAGHITDAPRAGFSAAACFEPNVEILAVPILTQAVLSHPEDQGFGNPQILTEALLDFQDRFG